MAVSRSSSGVVAILFVLPVSVGGSPISAIAFLYEMVFKLLWAC